MPPNPKAPSSRRAALALALALGVAAPGTGCGKPAGVAAGLAAATLINRKVLGHCYAICDPGWYCHQASGLCKKYHDRAPPPRLATGPAAAASPPVRPGGSGRPAAGPVAAGVSPSGAAQPAQAPEDASGTPLIYQIEERWARVSHSRTAEEEAAAAELVAQLVVTAGASSSLFGRAAGGREFDAEPRIRVALDAGGTLSEEPWASRALRFEVHQGDYRRSFEWHPIDVSNVRLLIRR